MECIISVQQRATALSPSSSTLAGGGSMIVKIITITAYRNNNNTNYAQYAIKIRIFNIRGYLCIETRFSLGP
jgi:hypothetical protein